MKPTSRFAISGYRIALSRRLRRYLDRDDGAMTILACFIILLMIIVSGVGLDLMHNEMDRTRLQNTIDRAVLAAADLDQTLDPKSVVEDYFDKAGMKEYLTNVTVDQGLGYRRVEARALMQTETWYMRYLGAPQLPVPASSEAVERVPKVEISLVLDVSGSMKNNGKIENLREAAELFVDTVIRPETAGQVSLSLVPYSEHVNVGEEIFDSLKVSQEHDYSYCLEIPDGFYNQTTLNTSHTWKQMQHFQWNYYSIQSGNEVNTVHDTVCPREWFEQIKPLSEDAAQINAQISQLRPRAGTSIFMGMKWGVALLDPSFRTVTWDLVSDGVVEPDFAVRPSDYTDGETLKTVVLMTDGENDRTHRIRETYYNKKDEIDFWAENNFWYYLDRNVKSKFWPNYYHEKYDRDTGDRLLENICDVAKDKGIVIWAVGFETTDHGAEQMKKCASTESHYFRVEGTAIKSAFETIARQINQLRLTL